MRGFVGKLARRGVRLLAPCLVAIAPAVAGPPDAPITFDLSESLQLKQPAPPAAKLQLEDPALRGTRRTGLDSFLQKVAPLDMQLGAGKPVFGPSPAPAPVPTLVAKPVASPAPRAVEDAPLKLSTTKQLGEFPARDWNRVADTDLRAPEALAPSPAAPRLELGSELARLALRAPVPPVAAASPAPARPKTIEPENADTGPDAMARARAALADARSQGLRGKARRAGGESLLVLPDFRTSGFQVGIGFNDRSGPFDRRLGRNPYGLDTDDSEPLRLKSDVEADRKPRKDDDGRVWTGVTFNF